MKHGASAYRTRRCRCPVCTQGNSVKHQREMERRQARLAANPSLAPHGCRNTYTNWGCRCEPCTAAGSATIRDWRAAQRAQAAANDLHSSTNRSGV